MGLLLSVDECDYVDVIWQFSGLGFEGFEVREHLCRQSLDCVHERRSGH